MLALSPPLDAMEPAEYAVQAGLQALSHVGLYLSTSSQVTARNAAVRWLATTATSRLGFPHRALFLAVQLLDRYLAAKPEQGSMIYVAAAALFVSAKFECVPRLKARRLLRECPPDITSKGLVASEAALLDVLDFRLAAPTPILFLGHFARTHDLTDDETDRASYLCTRSLEHYPLLEWPPSAIAMAAVQVALDVVPVGEGCAVEMLKLA